MRNTVGLKDFKNKIKGGGIKHFIRELRYELKFAWQRVWKGYDDTFWWSMDTVFIELYYHLFNDMVKSSMSHPHELTYMEWNNILKEMRDLLAGAHWEDKDYNTWDEIDFDKVKASKDEFFKVFSKYFYDLWD